MMELDAYLHRIGHHEPVRADLATLTALHRAHLFAIPFENLDIGWGRSITIDVERHYDKLVVRRRGGFCYEQNHLFSWALERIGFRVAALGAAVWSNRDGIGRFGDPAAHLLTRVDLEDAWIADVGFGENFRTLLRLVDGMVQDQGPVAYRLDRSLVTTEATWTLSTRDATGRWEPTYRFADVARPMTYFEGMCRFKQTSPASHFTKKRLCSIAVPTGRLTLSGDEWIVSGLDGSRAVTPIADEHEAARLLERHFGIEYRPWCAPA